MTNFYETLPVYHLDRQERPASEEFRMIRKACRRWHIPEATIDTFKLFVGLISGKVPPKNYFLEEYGIDAHEIEKQLLQLSDSTFLQVTADGIYVNWSLIYRLCELEDRHEVFPDEHPNYDLFEQD